MLYITHDNLRINYYKSRGLGPTVSRLISYMNSGQQAPGILLSKIENGKFIDKI